MNENNMLTITSDFEYYSCKFSPLKPDLICAAESQYYGMIGNGKVSVYQYDLINKKIQLLKYFPTNEGCFDVTWSETNENIITSSQGDGTIKFWDINSKNSFPIANISSHAGEVYSVNYSLTQTNLIISASADMTIRLHDTKNMTTLNSFTGHCGVVYNAIWHPTMDGVVASCSSDNTFKLWDLKSNEIIKSVKAHNSHVMFCDFNKYENIIATAGSDGSIATWDLRSTSKVPLACIQGHTLSVKRILYSPFSSKLMASVGYDMNCRVWDAQTCLPLNVFKHHKEFVQGIDFSLHTENLISTCGWDRTLSIFNL